MKRIIATILAALCVNAPAFELTLTAQENAGCEAEGGCIVISRLMIGQMLAHARRGGMATCERDI